MTAAREEWLGEVVEAPSEDRRRLDSKKDLLEQEKNSMGSGDEPPLVSLNSCLRLYPLGHVVLSHRDVVIA